MPTWRRTLSLRGRWLAATLAAMAVALALAGLFLHRLFQDHVMRQFQATLVQQLDQLTARLEFDASGQATIDPARLSDPRWQRPYSGLYWQLDEAGTTSENQGFLRSRSLWDDRLHPEADTPADGQVHVHQDTGPRGSTLLLVERTVFSADTPQRHWRLVVAGDLQEVTAASARFARVLAMSLLALGLLLALAALAQVAVGLAPLRALQRALTDLREGRTQRLQGAFPAEVQPLIDDFNGVLDRNAEVVERARTQAGNLAHALKTPLAVLDQAASSPAGTTPLAVLVKDQVGLARRHIDWHLKRSRVAAAQRLPGQRTPLAPVVDGLLRLLARVHAGRHLDLGCDDIPAEWAFAGEEQDLQEMLGNLMDNACLWARTQVHVGAELRGDRLEITVDDDGPGIAPEQRQAALSRGVRLDEATPGSGLGLAIVAELANLYGGALALEDGATGGLRARISLPATR
ncbi:sensor histidine kinase [Hydrogenophaga sp. RWCD_12]|uniref:sensor histidine kinase n=1 Tax=Hydrogenophaga sp. RWCD_12 TaxID=3391190 RepID=UPI003984F9D2